MQVVKRSSLFLSLALLLAGTPVWAADYVFAFHDTTTTTVYTANTLEFVNSVEVGQGAVHAIGVPDPNQTQSLLKIFVIRTDAVVVLEPDPPFLPVKTHTLSGPISFGENSAFLTPDGAKLVVIAGDLLHVFDAVDPANPSRESLLFTEPITGAVANTLSTRVHVITEGSTEITSVTLTANPPFILAGAIGLPDVPRVIGASPNGSGIYTASDTTFHEINSIDLDVTASALTELEGPKYMGFDLDAPVDSAFIVAGQRLGVMELSPVDRGRRFSPGDNLLEAVSPGGNMFLVTASGVIRRAGFNGGGFPTIGDPEGGSFGLPAIDADAAPISRGVVFGFGGTGRIVHLDAGGTVKRADVIPTMPITGIAVIEQFAAFRSELQIYGGNEQFAAPGDRLTKPLSTRLLSLDDRPLFRREITFTTELDTADITPTTALTNMYGVAQTTVVVPTLDPFEIEAVASETLSTTFNINTGGEGFDGLSKVGGDYQYVVSEEPLPLPLVVQAKLAGEPVFGLDLTISGPAGLVCTDDIETDEDGLAEFTCTAPLSVSANPVPFSIGVTDSFGRFLRDEFSVVVVATEDDLPRRILFDSPRPILATVGTTVTRAIFGRVVSNIGGPTGLAGITLTTPGDVMFPSPVVATNLPGQFETDVIFGCTPGSGMIAASLNAATPDTRMISYTASLGPAASIEKAQGDLQTGTAGQLLGAGDQALIAELKDSCGNAIGSEPVTWEVSPPGGVTFENKFNSTNGVGRTLAVVRLGDQLGQVLVTAHAGGLSTTFTLTVTGTGNGMEISGGDGQQLPIGGPAPTPLAVTIRDLEGTPVSGANVEYTVTQGTLQLSSMSVQTNDQGRASVSVVGSSALGVATVEVRSGALVVVFNLEVIGRKPVVSSVGFVNAGSFIVGFVPGSAGSIFGVGLMEGIDGVVLADTFPFPLELRGVKVFVDGIQCPITSISNVNGTEQINIQIPFEVRAPSDAIVVTIDNNGALSSFSNIQTFRAQPGFFEIPENGKRVVAALHLDFRRVSSENPARPGEVILLFLTGMGPLKTLVGTNVPGPGSPGVPPAETVENPVVTIDGVEQQVIGSFYAPGLISGYQVNIIIGPNVEVGDRLMQLIAGGVASQQTIIPMGAVIPKQ